MLTCPWSPTPGLPGVSSTPPIPSCPPTMDPQTLSVAITEQLSNPTFSQGRSSTPTRVFAGVSWSISPPSAPSPSSPSFLPLPDHKSPQITNLIISLLCLRTCVDFLSPSTAISKILSLGYQVLYFCYTFICPGAYQLSYCVPQALTFTSPLCSVFWGLGVYKLHFLNSFASWLSVGTRLMPITQPLGNWESEETIFLLHQECSGSRFQKSGWRWHLFSSSTLVKVAPLYWTQNRRDQQLPIL